MPQTDPVKSIADILVRRRLTLTTAESCTGGLVAHLITNVPGSSAYFVGGVVAYSNQLKQLLLGVPVGVLEAHGAVSEEAALAMARGAREQFGVDIAVSVTGVAGPGGGTVEKPVGLTWIAVSARDRDISRCFVWDGDREENKASSARAALDVLANYLSHKR